MNRLPQNGRSKVKIASLNSHYTGSQSGTRYCRSSRQGYRKRKPRRPRAYHILRFAFHITLLEETILVGNLNLILKCWPFSFSEAIVVLVSWSIFPSRVDFVERTRRSMYFLQSRQLASASSISITLRIWGKRQILFIIVKWGHFPW